jgi:anti-sigma factor RsiW
MADAYTDKLATYLDGELPPDEMREVDAHVRSCPSCAADVLGDVQLKRAVQSAGRRYSPSSEFRARVQQRVQGSRSSIFSGGKAGASVWSNWLTSVTVMTLLLIASVAAAYFGQRRLEREKIFSELADLHVATLASANPVDVVSTDRHTVKPWFQGKIPFSFNLPELQNSEFSLAGGRVTYLGQAPGAHLIYQIRKHQISVFIFQDRDLNGLSSDSGVRKRSSFEVDTWSRDGLRYFVVGDASPDDIRDLANRLRAAGSS